MTYFDFFNTVQYKFSDGLTKNVKNIFNRPIINSSVTENREINDGQSPDQLSISLYDDPSLYYINLLQNDIISDSYWPVSGEEFAENLESEYAGYSFHMLEQPESPPTTGDVIILKYDFNGFTPDQNDYTSETLSYGVVQSWDPHLRKLWIKNYNIGTTGANSESEFFKEDNRFYIFRRSDNGQYSNDATRLTATNVSGTNNAFTSDPNYPGNSGDEFTMKRVLPYYESLDSFFYDFTSTKLNPYTKNLSFVGSASSLSFINFAGTTYNSGNTNGTCSLLEAYILSANGQTGPDGSQYTTSTQTLTVESVAKDENEEKRNIKTVPESTLAQVIQNIESTFNG